MPVIATTNWLLVELELLPSSHKRKLTIRSRTLSRRNILFVAYEEGGKGTLLVLEAVIVLLVVMSTCKKSEKVRAWLAIF